MDMALKPNQTHGTIESCGTETGINVAHPFVVAPLPASTTDFVRTSTTSTTFTSTTRQERIPAASPLAT